MVSRLSPSIRHGVLEAIVYLIRRDYRSILGAFIDLEFIAPDEPDLDRFLPALTRVFDAALAGGGAKSINFDALAADLAELTFELPFRIPPYFALVIRAISVLEGIALSSDPDFAIIDSSYPFIARLLLNAPDDRTRDPFLLYAGRVDPQKGSLELLDWYAALRRVDPDPPRLVLIGESPSTHPRHPGLEARGFVDEETKRALMRRALAFVHPSPYESLGIVALEAMAARTPLLVNAATDALVEHCRRGKAGLWVRDGAEFCLAVDRLRRSPELAGTLGAAGRRYVTEEYSLAAYERRLLGEFPPS